MDLWFCRHELGHDSSKPKRVIAQLWPKPVVAGRRRVTLVEDEVDHLEHRGQAIAQLGPAGHGKRDARVGQRALGPHDTLGNRGLWCQERARDFIGRQAADDAKRQRHACRRRKDGVAGREHQAEKVVADVVVKGGIQTRFRAVRLSVALMGQRFVVVLEARASSEMVNGPVLRHAHEPGGRIAWEAGCGPLLERGQ